jgi:hypothetical protein
LFARVHPFGAHDRSLEMTSLSGKNAVVLGGSSGVGKATVKSLLSEGARVTAIGRDVEKLQALEAETERRAVTLTGDITAPGFVERLFRELRPELVVLAAGIKPAMGFVHELDWDEFSQAGTPKMDFVFTVCDNAAAEPCPYWPGQPVTAHWGVPDPAAVQGADEEKRSAFLEAFTTLARRVNLLVGLPFEELDNLSLRRKLQEIGKTGEEAKT